MVDNPNCKPELHKMYPEAYKIMLGFYCNTAYYNSDPLVRAADNVLMAIQYALDKVRNDG